MARRFETTRWSLVVQARGGSSPTAREALATICETYWQPLYAHVRRRGSTREEAEDLTQGFFAKLLERDDLSSVHPAGGRLRSFLLACLDNFLSNERERSRALKRGGGKLVSLDSAAFEARENLSDRSELSPDELYERHWALTVFRRAMTALRLECSPSQSRRLEALAPHLTGEGDDRLYRDIAVELDTTEGALKVALHRLRLRLGELLREEVGQTLLDPSDIDDELKHLLQALGSCGGGRR